jgi:hypothetical protein
MRHLAVISALVISFGLFAQTPISLKLNLEKGKTNKLRNTSKQNIQGNYNGMPFTTTVNANTTISYTLLSQDKDQLLIEFKLDTIQSKTTSPMGNKETNSAKIAKKTEYFERIMNRFSSNTITAKITSSGKFIGFENYKSFKNNVLLGMDSVPENKKDQIQKQVDMLLKESAVQSMIEPLFSYLPDKAVKNGDQWETSYSVAGGGLTGMMFNTLILENTDQTTAQLNLKSELESLPSDAESAGMKLDVKGKSTGSITIDIKTGTIIKSTDKKHYEGAMTAKNQGNEIKIPLVIEAESETIKL